MRLDKSVASIEGHRARERASTVMRGADMGPVARDRAGWVEARNLDAFDKSSCNYIA